LAIIAQNVGEPCQKMESLLRESQYYWRKFQQKPQIPNFCVNYPIVEVHKACHHHGIESEGTHWRQLQINCCHSTNRTDASSAKSLATYKYVAKKQQGG
jgi:hypothetical protein